jgi:hypothetical protein
MRPKYTKKDKNHKKIVRECRELGMILWDTADIGGKILDLIVFWRGKALPVEVKQKGKEDDLTEEEKIGIEELRFVGIEPVVATCLEDILKAFE